MVKGIHRQMVMVRTTESELFEMAYFVIRADARTKSTQKSIITEANSIVSAMCEDSAREKKKKRKRRAARILLFGSGAACGSLTLFGLLTLLRLIGVWG